MPAALQQTPAVGGGRRQRSERHILYNPLLSFDDTGALAGRHRKLMAEGGERLIRGVGDGSGLTCRDPEGIRRGSSLPG